MISTLKLQFPWKWQDLLVTACFSATAGDEVTSSHTGLSYNVSDVGILQIKQISLKRL